MSNDERHIHHGSFAAGQAGDEHAHERHTSSFAGGEAMPERYDGEGRVGTFAEGEAMPETYPGEDHVGSFGDSAA